MSKKASKTLIGAFVLGAVVLIVAGVVVFGGGKFFKKTINFVTFFEGSLKGLSVGSPVTFRGVKIGEVTNIVPRFNTKSMSVLIPVYIEINPETFQSDVKARKKYQYT
ncbi:MAG: MlaD family protein, partial [Thermodesulfovibrionales bacterium]